MGKKELLGENTRENIYHCIKCGLCIAHCPVYKEVLLEAAIGHRDAVGDDKEICAAKPLKNIGYATGVFGKWRQLTAMSNKAQAAVWGYDEFFLWGTGDGEKTRAGHNHSDDSVHAIQGSPHIN